MARPVKFALLLLACAIATGCTLPYYWQAVGGQVSLLRRRVPLDEVLASPSLDPEKRERLEAVVELRRFAEERLGLPADGSYSSYVDLGRNYVVWNVIAAERFSVDPVQWCFPVAGCVSYRGYFDREKALAFERRLREDGYDTYSGGSPAYSTLGYFDDPILSTMIAGSRTDLAATLFHELAHQRVYIKGDSELSEGFASAVEEFGVELMLEARSDPAGLEAYRARRRRAAEFTTLVDRQRTRLAALYAEPLPESALLTGKEAAFEQMRADYAALKASWGGASDYDGWFGGTLNNARLAAIATYSQWLPGLRWRLRSVGPEAFYDEIEMLSRLDPEDRNARLAQWNAASVVGAGAESAGLVGRDAQAKSRLAGESAR